MAPAWAPLLHGRMAPGLFTSRVDRRPRFPGDPWPSQIAPPIWYWMHSTACREHERGSTHGLYRAWAIAPALRSCN
jgi:hypothetical protein